MSASKAAWDAGDKAKAKELSDAAKAEGARAEALSVDACQKIFAFKNAAGRVHPLEIDLYVRQSREGCPVQSSTSESEACVEAQAASAGTSAAAAQEEGRLKHTTSGSLTEHPPGTACRLWRRWASQRAVWSVTHGLDLPPRRCWCVVATRTAAFRTGLRTAPRAVRYSPSFMSTCWSPGVRAAHGHCLGFPPETRHSHTPLQVVIYGAGHHSVGNKQKIKPAILDLIASFPTPHTTREDWNGITNSANPGCCTVQYGATAAGGAAVAAPATPAAEERQPGCRCSIM